jgi:uncharacterized RDD family membrane protein YckC
MKCPKCGYLGFEQVDRCRNCGYEFSLAKTTVLPELALNAGSSEDAHPAADFSFMAEPSRASEQSTPPDLPLFAPPVDDRPLITKASPPRTPLAVRRATPEPARLRAEPRAQSFDLAFDPESAPTVPRPPALRSVDSSRRGAESRQSRDEPGTSSFQDAGLGARFFAVASDVLILCTVDAFVVYFTMQICGLNWSELAILPKTPMLAFLIVQNGGYFVAFTAGGQTLGKMAAGIRVVTADDAEPLSVGRAGLRTLMWTLLALPAGLGFLTACFRSDHRGLHDRFAGTRVVRASA